MEASSVCQTYEYDGRGQLLAVKEGDADVERYAYDKAGNMTKKSLLRPAALAELRDGRACRSATASDYTTTTFAFDGANQLVSSTTDGVTTQYAYDAAGRLVKEGDKTYRYGYLDKVLSVTEGERKYTYDYHVDGQLARANYGNGVGNGGRAGCPQPAGSEDFLWDGLALIRRGDERFVNEPHIGGGNPVASSMGTTYFNDALGTTVGIREGRASSRQKSGRKYTAAALTAFGEDLSYNSQPQPSTSTSFYTGKPLVEGLGYAFLFRNYRASLAKWQTADPLGYPDGWNQLAYCENRIISDVDVYGAKMAKGGICWNERTVTEMIGPAPGWTISNQIYLYRDKTVSDRFDVTIPYLGKNDNGVADIAVGQITGKWSLYGVWNDSPDRDGMATSVGWSFCFIRTGRTYFATYGIPDIWRSEDKKRGFVHKCGCVGG